MRNLNLSRLARASESSFFKKEQAQQALSIRESLTDAERALITKADGAKGMSPDVLSEISAHSTYSKAIKHAANDANYRKPTRMVARPLLPPVDISTLQQASKRQDEKLMRALGTGKMSLYSAKNAHVESRPLPGGAQYADGAVIGIASFSIASAIVASIGLAGIGALYFNPRIIQRWKESTIRLKERLDSKVGGFIRQQVTARMISSSAVSEETRQKASSFARAAVGLHPERQTTAEAASTTQPPNKSS